ncbi:hypothetical protein AOQ84DRAFT_226880 [Glonium stellatum]|uniref:Uncharacterized protein n=1 Tax=Glonium stellatum TaxID=574774 RepID=A0A8E2FA21_9PEZI|nr:hypothetical protein AOQ84DRAFT_226880 [Glonium stellatum]
MGKEPESPSIKALHSFPARLKKSLYNLWLFTKDDTPTFVAPNTVFGICGALAGTRLIAHSGSTTAVLSRIPHVLLFNWSNLLIFNLANQQLPESCAEDTLNKPWRPVPSGRMTSTQVRKWMLLTIPLVLAINHFALDVGTETALLYTLTWLYNDLRGGDEGWLLRNSIIAAAFGLYNLGSLKIAAAATPAPVAAATVTGTGYAWIAIVSAVILTTMHVQDLKDVAGDRARGRRTAPLVMGDGPARWTLALPVPVWTAYCACFWGLGWVLAAPAAGLGGVVAWRCFCVRGTMADRKTWQLWRLWTAVLYMMPLVR